MKKGEYHEPVMVREVCKALHIKNQGRPACNVLSVANAGRYIDATVGTGGHAEEIIKRGGILLGIDFDPEILEVAKERLKAVLLRQVADAASSAEAASKAEPKLWRPSGFGGPEACPPLNHTVQGLPFKLVVANFKDIEKIAKDNGFDQVDGILFDLGVSNIHLTSGMRGFSFANRESPLDMRINREKQGVRAADLLNALREDQLISLFEEVLEKRVAKKVARQVIEKRKVAKIETVGDFLEICNLVAGKPGLHPATLPFLAVRIAVNSELENLNQTLPFAFSLLRKGGRLVILSFHSGEDRIVKDFFKQKERQGEAEILTKKPFTPNEDEIETNPRARSAKLRVLFKI